MFVLNAGYACALATPPSTALGMALHAIILLFHRDHPTQISVSGARLHVVPLCPREVSPADFKHAAEPIDPALISTDAWLRAGLPDLDHHHDLSAR